MKLPPEPLPGRIGNQRPRLSVLPSQRVGSSGPDAIEFAESLGYELDDWQKWCIEGILSEDEALQLCASVVCLIVSRQNGKNVILEVVELYCFYILEWDLIQHTAHLATTAANHMAQMMAVVEANPVLDEITVFTVANGKEKMTRIDTGAEIKFITRGKKAGRGPSPKMVVFDEALYVTDAQIKALIPSMSAQSMSEDLPLMVYTSSAPLEESMVLHRIRNSFIAGVIDGWFAEWSVEDTEENPIDHTDIELWFAANPAMGVRISPDWVRDNELAIMTRLDFMGERLGVAIGGGDESGNAAIPFQHWMACEDLGSEIAEGADSWWAIDVSPGMQWVSFAEAGKRDDDDLHIEIITRNPGTHWVIDEAKRIYHRLGTPVLVDPHGPGRGMIDRLRKAGVPVEEVETQEVIDSCSGFQFDVLNHRIHHIRQAPLQAAVMGAGVRPVGESWVWSPKSSDVDITALRACTLAAGRARIFVEQDGGLWFATT